MAAERSEGEVQNQAMTPLMTFRNQKSGRDEERNVPKLHFPPVQQWERTIDRDMCRKQ
jgi:hypothetical protein